MDLRKMENVEILEGNIKFKNKHKIPQKAQYIKNSTEICSYGCGNIAKYLFINKKWCCHSVYHRCPAKRKLQYDIKKQYDKDIEEFKQKLINDGILDADNYESWNDLLKNQSFIYDDEKIIYKYAELRIMFKEYLEIQKNN